MFVCVRACVRALCARMCVCGMPERENLKFYFVSATGPKRERQRQRQTDRDRHTKGETVCVVCVLWPMNITDLTSCTCWLTSQNRPLRHTDEDKIMPMNAPLSVRTVGFARRNLSPSGRRVAPCVHLGALHACRGVEDPLPASAETGDRAHRRLSLFIAVGKPSTSLQNSYRRRKAGQTRFAAGLGNNRKTIP